MTTAPPTDTTDTASAALAAVSDADARVKRDEVDRFAGVASWAECHLDGVTADPFGPYGILEEPIAHEVAALSDWDSLLELGGPGTPLVSDFAINELACALGRSRASGRQLLGDALEAKYRLPKIWAQMLAGDVEVWRVREVAKLTRPLSIEGADYVDRHLHGFVGRLGFKAIEGLVAEAAAIYDPETAEIPGTESLDKLKVDIDLDNCDLRTGLLSEGVSVDAFLRRDDAEDLEAAVARIAAELSSNGSLRSLNDRRAIALGMLARGDVHLPANASANATDDAEAATDTDTDTDTDEASTRRTPSRQVVLHVHLSEGAVRPPELGGGPQIHPLTGALGVDLARVEGHSAPALADHIRAWCDGDAQVIVKPVIDLNEAVAVDAYEIPDRIRERVVLTRGTCAFPWCNRQARSCDLDHIEEYRSTDEGGPPGQTSTENLAPLCRTHHRAKTHPSPNGKRWRYRRARAGTYLWTSPHGRQYVVDPHGTSRLLPNS